MSLRLFLFAVVVVGIASFVCRCQAISSSLLSLSHYVFLCFFFLFIFVHHLWLLEMNIIGLWRKHAINSQFPFDECLKDVKWSFHCLRYFIVKHWRCHQSVSSVFLAIDGVLIIVFPTRTENPLNRHQVNDHQSWYWFVSTGSYVGGSQSPYYFRWPFHAIIAYISVFSNALRQMPINYIASVSRFFVSNERDKFSSGTSLLHSMTFLCNITCYVPIAQ